MTLTIRDNLDGELIAQVDACASPPSLVLTKCHPAFEPRFSRIVKNGLRNPGKLERFNAPVTEPERLLRNTGEMLKYLYEFDYEMVTLGKAQ